MCWSVFSIAVLPKILRKLREIDFFCISLLTKRVFMTKEIVKHRKDERKKPQLTPKEKKAKKLEKKQNKSGKI